MRGIKIPKQNFALKLQGEAYAQRGAYLQDTTVFAGHYCICQIVPFKRSRIFP